MISFRRTLLTLSVLVTLAIAASAQVSYTGGSYTQNFDTLTDLTISTAVNLGGPGPFALTGSPMNGSGLTGWSLARMTGSNANALFASGTGSSNTGAVYSFGALNNSERALGILQSGATNPTVGVVFTNDTGATINSFTVTYTGEQWRYGGTSGTDRLAFEYQVGGTSISSGTFTAVTALDFSSPVHGNGTTVTGFALSGNAAANRQVITASVGGIFWAPGQSLVLRWTDFNVTGSDDGLAIDDFSFTLGGGGGGPTYTPMAIHTVQGSGTASPHVGANVAVEGIVTASFQGTGGLGGFYVQAPEADYDSDPATSEGIFVFNNTFPATAGDLVKVTGTVAEFGPATKTQTEMTNVTSVAKLASGAALPAPVVITLPFADLTSGERYEGMRATLPQTLTVTDNFDLGHFGEVFLSLGRLAQPTNVVAPGAPANALEVSNYLSQILLDDAVGFTYPDPTPYLADSNGRGATRRAGSTTANVTGIFDQKFGSYIIEPTETVSFTDANPRIDPPVVAGTLKVAIGNVLNFFNGNGSGLADPAAAGFIPRSHQRGADNLAEFERQRVKIIAGITAMAPDIMGLTEVENDRITNLLPDSYGPTSAIVNLVNGLNAAAPSGTTYAFVNAAAVDIVTDDIHCAFIYRTETVVPVGPPAMLNDISFNGIARNPLAQTFQQLSTGEKLTISINHFKSKGSGSFYPSTAANADQGDGQGASNAVRKLQAQALVNWLATDPTGSGDPDFLIIGDLNAYAKEDPIAILEAGGYINLTEAAEGPGGYSYAFNGAFGHLDHALANGHLAEQVVDAATWHVNSDEPVFYDYNIVDDGYTKTAAQQAINATGAYRYSDHDPVVVGISLHPEYAAPSFLTPPADQTVILGQPASFSVIVAGYPAPTLQWFKDGNLIPGATGSSYAIATTTMADAGNYSVVATNSQGTASSSAALVVQDTTPPVLTLPANQVIEATGPSGAVATFSASALDNVDGPVAVVHSPLPGSTFPLGATTVTATATDTAGNTASGTFTITVVDTTAPVVASLVASSTQLWPANHKMVAVTLTATATDAASSPVTFKIISAVSNEPDNGLGDGDTAGDIVITGPMTLSLRAERAGNGPGRIYTLTVLATDSAGNTGTQTVTVSVPRNN
jgi:predicted extracellular nuclease